MIRPIYLYGSEVLRQVAAPADLKDKEYLDNLITDMTFQGATDDELVRAVKHSMVVIDTGKHKLNYKQSYIDNNIAELPCSLFRYVVSQQRTLKVYGTVRRVVYFHPSSIIPLMILVREVDRVNFRKQN